MSASNSSTEAMTNHSLPVLQELGTEEELQDSDGRTHGEGEGNS